MLFVKIKQQDLLYHNKIISDSIAYFMRVYVIYIIFPRASQFDLQANCKHVQKLSVLNTKTKKVEKVVTTLKD